MRFCYSTINKHKTKINTNRKALLSKDTLFNRETIYKPKSKVPIIPPERKITANKLVTSPSSIIVPSPTRMHIYQ